MSVINRMLQDLDRRNALPGSDAKASAVPVGGSLSEHRREWFWRVLAALMLAGVAWTAWVAYQLRPAELATPQAFAAAEKARAKAQNQVSGPVASVPAPLAAVLPPKEPAAAPTAAAPSAPAVPKAVDAPPKAMEAPARAGAPASPPPRRPSRSLASLELPPAKVLAGPAQKVERRDRQASPAEVAERGFRRAAALLRQGRQAEAEEGFAWALVQDAGHRGARQALVALKLERGDLEGARRLLEAGLANDPEQPDFATALARIHVERRDLEAALAALQGSSGGATSHAEFHFMRGTVLQRMGRHQEAAGAYRTSLHLASGSPQAWIGLGISLEALKELPEAADAFRRALAVGPGNPELKTFAEQRIKALR